MIHQILFCLRDLNNTVKKNDAGGLFPCSLSQTDLFTGVIGLRYRRMEKLSIYICHAVSKDV